MKIKQINLYILFISVIVLSHACKKPEPGPPGKDGVANIKTRTQTTANNNWIYNEFENSYDVVLTIPEITAAVVNEGTIQVFFDIGTNAPNWAAMPFAYGDLQYNYDYLIGIVNVYVTLGSNNVPENPGGVRFKVVIIPPASKSKDANAVDLFEKQEIIVQVK
jgi:hypothetical protein